MANVDLPNGFRPVISENISQPHVGTYVAKANESWKAGDIAVYHTDGTVMLGSASSASALGVFASDVTTATSGQEVPIYDDPEQIFEGQFDGTPGRTALYTCSASANCYDIKGTTGVMEINDGATSIEIIKVVGFPVNNYFNKGLLNDLASANARAYFKFNKHLARPGV